MRAQWSGWPAEGKIRLKYRGLGRICILTLIMLTPNVTTQPQPESGATFFAARIFSIFVLLNLVSIKLDLTITGGDRPIEIIIEGK